MVTHIHSRTQTQVHTSARVNGHACCAHSHTQLVLAHTPVQGDWMMYGGVLKQAKAALDEALALCPDHVLSMVRWP